MVRCDLVRQVAVRLALELVHGYAVDTAAGLTGTAGRGFHYAKVAARADRKACLREAMPQILCLQILGRVLTAFRASKDRDYPFRQVAHVTLPFSTANCCYS